MWRQLSRRCVRRTTLISIGSAAFLCGIGLARLGWAVPWAIGLSSIGLLVLCHRRKLLIALPVVVLVGTTLGLWRGSEMLLQLKSYDALAGQKVQLTGSVVQDSTYGAKRQVDFMINHVQIGGRSLPGQVRVTTFDPVEPRQGDTVQVTAKLKPGFGSYQAGMYFAKVELQRQNDSWLTQLRRQFSAAILNVIPEPQASLGLGFLLGIKSQLPQTLSDQLKIVGLTHIVVASGYNLTILVRAARRLWAKRSKFQATLFAVLLMVGFLGITGLSPSMSRAALVTSLSLAAWYYGRIVQPFVLLFFAAALTAAVNPLYVWGDLGWYLSFLAFAGVLVGAPLLQKRLFTQRQPSQIAQILLETLCAEAMTLPLILLVFGTTSTIGIVSNLLIAPLVPAVMLLTFVAGLGSWALPVVGPWLALPAIWLLNLMTTLIGALAAIPWAATSVTITAPTMLGLYSVLITAGGVVWYRTRHIDIRRSVVD